MISFLVLMKNDIYEEENVSRLLMTGGLGSSSVTPRDGIPKLLLAENWFMR